MLPKFNELKGGPVICLLFCGMWLSIEGFRIPGLEVSEPAMEDSDSAGAVGTWDGKVEVKQ